MSDASLPRGPIGKQEVSDDESKTDQNLQYIEERIKDWFLPRLITDIQKVNFKTMAVDYLRVAKISETSFFKRKNLGIDYKKVHDLPSWVSETEYEIFLIFSNYYGVSASAKGSDSKALEAKGAYTWTSRSIPMDSIDWLFQVRTDVSAPKVLANFNSSSSYGIDREDLITVIEYLPGRYFMADGTHRCIAQWLKFEQSKSRDTLKISACVLSPRT